MIELNAATRLRAAPSGSRGASTSSDADEDKLDVEFDKIVAYIPTVLNVSGAKVKKGDGLVQWKADNFVASVGRGKSIEFDFSAEYGSKVYSAFLVLETNTDCLTLREDDFHVEVESLSEFKSHFTGTSKAYKKGLVKATNDCTEKATELKTLFDYLNDLSKVFK